VVFGEEEKKVGISQLFLLKEGDLISLSKILVDGRSEQQKRRKRNASSTQFHHYFTGRFFIHKRVLFNLFNAYSLGLVIFWLKEICAKPALEILA